MANPTTAKPTSLTTEWTNSGAGTSMRAGCIFQGAGPPRDFVGNKLLYGSIGQYGHGTGHAPARVAAGFTLSSLSDPTYKFTPGSQALVLSGAGWGAGPTDPRTLWIMFKPVAYPGPVARNVPLWGNGSRSTGQWIGYTVGTDGVITLGQFNNANSNFANATFTSPTTINLTSGSWYLVSMTFTSTTGRLWNVYNFTTQAYVTVAGTGLAQAGATSYTTPNLTDLCLNPGIGFNSYENVGFTGEVYACGASDVTWSPATNTYFADHVADPCVGARSANAGGGALTAGGIRLWDETTTAITIHSNRPSGGTAGSYQFRLHRSSSPSFTPDSTTRVGSLQASPVFVDTTAGADTNYFYKVEQYDGTDTVYSTTATTDYSQTAGRLSKGDKFFGVCSDSRWCINDGRFAGPTVCQMLRSKNYRTGCFNMGLSSTAWKSATVGLSWQPNTVQDPLNGQASTTLLAQAIVALAAEGVTELFFALGVNDAGTGGFSGVEIAANAAITLNYLVSLGYTAVVLPPFLALGATSTEGRATAVFDSQATLRALDNNTTITVLGTESFDLSCTGVSSLTYDGVHLTFGPLEGHAAANAVEDGAFETVILRTTYGLSIYG